MNKLWLRLAISFLVLTLLMIAAVAWVVSASVEASFSQYVSASNLERLGGDLVSALEHYYAEQDSWEGVETLLPGHSGQGAGSGAGSGGDRRGAQIFIADAGGTILAATQPDWIGLPAEDIGQSRQVSLQVDGRVVGILGEQTPGALALTEAENRFLQETTNGLLITGIIAALVTLLVSIALAYSLTRPLRHLSEQISAWRLPDKEGKVQAQGTEEIRQLGNAFNDLLARLREGENQRQRMSADIAHELRTPVTVMRGNLEAMMDGVYPLDTAHLAVAYDQVLHLARLVEDLRLLTQAEAGRLPLNKTQLDLKQTIQATIERFSPLTTDQNIQIVAHLPDDPAFVYADPHRVQQVLDNLLNNAVRHTPRHSEIHLEVLPEGEKVTVTIANPSERPLSEEQLAHLFERFWRGEDARERDTGGSGLGLAITRELLRLQGGDIVAVGVEGGLQMNFSLPCTRFV